jgi:hypothetical protein
MNLEKRRRLQMPILAVNFGEYTLSIIEKFQAALKCRLGKRGI